MLSEAEARMPDIVKPDARKERGYRECIPRYCRENVIEKAKVEDVRRYGSIGIRRREGIDVMLSHSIGTRPGDF